MYTLLPILFATLFSALGLQKDDEVKYYKSIQDFTNNKPTTRLNAYFSDGVQYFDLEDKKKQSNYRFFRLRNMDRYYPEPIAMIDYEFDNKTLAIHHLRVYGPTLNETISSKLLEQAENQAQEKGINISEVYIHRNKNEEDFYTKSGYVYVYNKIDEHIKWARNRNYIKMEKKLT